MRKKVRKRFCIVVDFIRSKTKINTNINMGNRKKTNTRKRKMNKTEDTPRDDTYGTNNETNGRNHRE